MPESLRITHALWAAALVAASVALLGCDKSGVHDLGRPKDTLSVCGSPTSTWVRSLDEGTEVFVLGTTDPGLAASSGCYVRALVHDDSTVEMDTGSFEVDLASVGSVAITATYTFPFQPELPPLQRRGARREDFDVPMARTLAFTRDGAQLLVMLDGEQRRLTALPEIIRRLDTETQAGAEDIYRLVNIQFYMTQVRIEGFGATGLTQYTAPSTFVGITAGEYRIAVENVRLDVLVDLSYTSLRDLSDIRLDGNQHTDVDLSGSGDTSDALTYTIDHPDRRAPIIVVQHYDFAKITNGVASSGYYPLEVDGTTFDIDYTLQNDVHLRNILPVGE